MLIRQCDICGRIVKNDLVYMTVKRSGMSITKSFDLCIDCYDKLIDLMVVEEDDHEEISE